MAMGTKAELSAQLSRLVADNRHEEARAYAKRLRAVAEQPPAPLQLGDHEMLPTAEAVAQLVAHVFESPAEFERFVRRWYPDAAPGVSPSMPLDAQARTVIEHYTPRALAVDLKACYPERVVSFGPSKRR